MGNDNMTASPSGTFRTGDGLLNISANKQEQFEMLAGIIQRPDLLEDARFATREPRKLNRAALRIEIEAALADGSARDWAQRLNAEGVPAGEVLSIPAVLEHPQITERNLVLTFPVVAGVDRPVDVVRSGFRLASGDPRPRLPPPTLGEHTDDVLSEIGLNAAEIAQLRSETII
jgi:crotonobetainyl-CoA:carnitine CoA-transferase CaiB-like acyl-CoA transferase